MKFWIKLNLIVVAAVVVGDVLVRATHIWWIDVPFYMLVVVLIIKRLAAWVDA
jgi:hypothetical protein